jgi:hypothetical protein
MSSGSMRVSPLLLRSERELLARFLGAAPQRGERSAAEQSPPLATDDDFAEWLAERRAAQDMRLMQLDREDAESMDDERIAGLAPH